MLIIKADIDENDLDRCNVTITATMLYSEWVKLAESDYKTSIQRRFNDLVLGQIQTIRDSLKSRYSEDEHTEF